MLNVLPKNSINIVLLGDPKVGKTCLVSAFKGFGFPGYLPPVFSSIEKNISAELDWHVVKVVDTSSYDDAPLTKQRAYNIRQADIAMICYSVTDAKSLRNVQKKWIPEVRKLVKDDSILIAVVGLKIDMGMEIDHVDLLKIRNEEKEILLDFIEDPLVKGCPLYCSSLSCQYVSSVFKNVVIGYLRRRHSGRHNFQISKTMEEKEELERIESVIENFGDINIITETKDIVLWKFLLIHSSIPNLKEMEDYESLSSLSFPNIDRKILFFLLLGQEDVEKEELKNENLVEYYWFFRNLGLKNEMSLIINNYLPKRLETFEECFPIFEQISKYETKIIQSWFTCYGHSEVNMEMTPSITADSFNTSFALVLFDLMEEKRSDVEKMMKTINPIILDHLEKYEMIDPMEHKDFGGGCENVDEMYSTEQVFLRLRNCDDGGVSWTANVKLISTDGKNFLCHKEMLTYRMSYFKRMFEFPGAEKEAIENEKLATISIVDMDSEVMSCVLDFVYLDSFREERVEVLIKIIVNAQKYLAKNLSDCALHKLSLIAENSPERNLEKIKELIEEKLCLMLYQNDLVNEMVIPKLVEWSEKKLSRRDILDLIETSFKKKKKSMEIISKLMRFEDVEILIEKNEEDLGEVKMETDNIDIQMERMKRFMKEKLGYEE